MVGISKRGRETTIIIITLNKLENISEMNVWQNTVQCSFSMQMHHWFGTAKKVKILFSMP